MKPDPRLLKHFFDQRRLDIDRCLGPDLDCDAPAIKAHSIQNSRVFDLLSENNHVICPSMKIDGKFGPTLSFEPIGRNKASVFTGLCSSHDDSIFREIDTGTIDPSNQRQQLLFAYRAVIREFHASLSGALRIQGHYLKRVEIGADPKDQPSEAGVSAVMHMYKSWSAFRYKCEIEDILYNDHNEFLTHSLLIRQSSPTLAVASLFSLDDHGLVEDMCGVCLTIVPVTRTDTWVMIGYLARDKDRVVRDVISRIPPDSIAARRYLSKLVLNNSENIAISPRFFWEMPEKRRKYIEKYFLETAFKGSMDIQDDRLMLFE